MTLDEIETAADQTDQYTQNLIVALVEQIRRANARLDAIEQKHEAREDYEREQNERER